MYVISIVEAVEIFSSFVYRFNCKLVERVETDNLMHLLLLLQIGKGVPGGGRAGVV